MQRNASAIVGRTATVGLAALFAACSSNDTTTPPATGYIEAKLVADVSTLGATYIDTNLVNPWGIVIGPTGLLQVANNHTSTSTQYDVNGIRQSLVARIPTDTGTSGGGAPTGMIYNATSDFVVGGSGPARFIVAGEDGVISAWNASTGDAQKVADRSSSDAVYKGIAMASNGGANYLYATNFKQNSVDVFSATFQFMSSFTDATVPAGYAPFGIQTIGGNLYVTFAKQKAPDNEDDQSGVGNGYVDVFSPAGTLVKRFASTGTLNSPWGMAMAPAGFGTFAGDILIGNFGDGLIGAYDATTGAYKGLLQDANKTNIVIEGLWGLTFGSGAKATTLFFTSGPTEESHGLLGTLTPH